MYTTVFCSIRLKQLNTIVYCTLIFTIVRFLRLEYLGILLGYYSKCITLFFCWTVNALYLSNYYLIQIFILHLLSVSL